MKNIGDYIPILIAIAFGLFQLFRFLGKGGGPEKPKSSPPTDPFGSDKEPGWDDLLEALGQKPKPKNSGPTQVPPPTPRIEPVFPKIRTFVPPPVPRQVPEIPRTIARAEIPPPAPVPYEIYQPKIAEETALKFKTFDTENAEASHAPVVLLESTPSAMPSSRFRHFLANRDRLREAVVLSEILNKPVALR